MKMDAFISLVLMVTLFVLAGCSSSIPIHPKITQMDAPTRLSLQQADDVTFYAVGLVGTPYLYGGNTPASGFDCSGFIGHVYRSRASVVPPRTVLKLKDWGQPVRSNSARAGDIVLFGQQGITTHAGIYVGDGRFVHAPSSGGEVRLDDLNSSYWGTQQAVFRRP
jgi:cell wall-associated NlpC family hydrolase